MKHNIALHGATPFKMSYIEKQLQLHGEVVAHGPGNYLVYMEGKWIHSNTAMDREVLSLGEVVPFLEQHGNGRPVPDSEWEVINEEIEADKYGYEKPLGVGEFLERVVQ